MNHSSLFVIRSLHLAQTGFTLVEALVAVVLLAVVVGAALVLEQGFLKRELGVYETPALGLQRTGLSAALRADFGSAGWGMTATLPAQPSGALALPVDTSTGQRLPCVAAINGSCGAQARGSQVTLLFGMPAADVSYLAQDVSGAALNQVCVRGVYRQNYQASDYLLLEDFSAGASALYQVLSTPAAPSATGSVCMALSGVGSGSPAWGRLYSMPVDFQHTFPTGSGVVKLQAPVDWVLSGKILYRRMGSGPYTLAAFGVQQFSVAQLTTPGGTGYQVLLQLASEGVEVVDNPGNPAASVVGTLVVFPRALNLCFNPQNGS